MASTLQTLADWISTWGEGPPLTHTRRWREAVLKKTSAFREQFTALTTSAEWKELRKARLRLLEADLQNLLT